MRNRTAMLHPNHDNSAETVDHASSLPDAGKFVAQPASQTRSIFVIGDIGSGKTTWASNVAGRSDCHKLSLHSQTKGILIYEFSVTENLPSGEIIVHHFKVCDSEGFTGNPLKDIAILHNILTLMKKKTTEIHAIYYCFSAVRFRESNFQSLRLVVQHGGSELVRRMKFIVTNAPDRLIDDEFRAETFTILRSILKRDITHEDITYSNLVDPHQFAEDESAYASTLSYWYKCMKRSQANIMKISVHDAFPLDTITQTRKFLSVLRVYSVHILLLILVLMVCILVIFCILEMQLLLREKHGTAQVNKVLNEMKTSRTAAMAAFERMMELWM